MNQNFICLLIEFHIFILIHLWRKGKTLDVAFGFDFDPLINSSVQSCPKQIALLDVQLNCGSIEYCRGLSLASKLWPDFDSNLLCAEFDFFFRLCCESSLRYFYEALNQATQGIPSRRFWKILLSRAAQLARVSILQYILPFDSLALSYSVQLQGHGLFWPWKSAVVSYILKVG